MAHELQEFTYEGRNITSEESQTLVSLMLIMKDPGFEIPFHEDPVLMDEFLGKVLDKRIKVFKLPYTMTNLFFVASLATFVKRVGQAVMLLWMVKKYAEKTGKSVLTLSDWVDMFPYKVPSEEDMGVWWEAQKVDDEGCCNNALDQPTTWGCNEGEK